MNIRKSFIDFFKNHNHHHQDSSSLLPAQDKSLLFTNSGMVQFKDYFLGIQNPSYKKIVSCQKCVRAGGKHNDLENIGFTNRHHSFFEMLGNFSFGEYFKDEAIKYAWQYLVDELNIPKDKLFVSVHKTDEDSLLIWQKEIGIKKDRIWILGDEDNFWQMGTTGPCGPCTEIYYDYGDDFSGEIPTKGNPGDRYVEIWNLVFTQYDKNKNGELLNLPRKCVDTGMGLERIHAVVEGKSDNYDTSLFSDLTEYINNTFNDKEIPKHVRKIILDHCRSSCLLISDGVMPSNEGRGYVLRRIIRRATRYLYNLGIEEPLIYLSSRVVSKSLGEVYPYLSKKENHISETLKNEEVNYLGTLENGLSLIDKLTKKSDFISGDNIFKLYDTYGFPLEIVEEIAKEKKLKLDIENFTKLMTQQKERSKASSNFYMKDNTSNLTYNTNFIGYDKTTTKSDVLDIIVSDKSVSSIKGSDSSFYLVLKETVFYPEGGGQIADIGEMKNDKCLIEVLDVKKINNSIIHYVRLLSGELAISDRLNLQIDISRRNKISVNHSATHLMHQALRETLGTHVEQKGSLVTNDYLRFDFSHNKNISSAEMSQIEMNVAREINKSIKTKIKNMKYKDAIDMGALAFFDEKYGEQVRVLFIGNNSIELCGGTHVQNTSEIRTFKILSESSISSGIRRVEAVAGDGAQDMFNKLFDQNKSISKILNTNQSDAVESVIKLKEAEDIAKKDYMQLSKKYIQLYAGSLESYQSASSEIFIHDCYDISKDQIKMLSDHIKAKFQDSISILSQKNNGSVYLSIGISKKCKHKYNAKNIIGELQKKFTCKGGGSETFATLIVEDNNVTSIINYVKSLL